MLYTRRWASLRDATLSYLHWEGPSPDCPILVFSHASGFNAQTYHRLLSPLADTFEIFAPDARGHGLTQLPADAESAPGWCLYWGDLLAFLDEHLPSNRGVYLAGHSLGAVISLEASLRRQDRILGLAMVEPALPPPIPLALFAIARRVGQAKRFGIVARAAKRRDIWPSKEALISAYHGRGAFESWERDWVADYIEGGTRTLANGDIQLTCAPAWESWTFAHTAAGTWRSLRHVQTPTVVMRGETSNTFLRRSKSMVPAWQRVETIPGTSHFLPMEAPAEVRRTLRALPLNIP